VVGGKVLDGDRTTPFLETSCPCYIPDWHHLSPYTTDFSLRQESRAGTRMNARLGESLTGILQVDARGTDRSSGASLEWAYFNYAPSGDWSMQLGRKRLPIYYYSDFMDVGFAYPWVRPPQDLYGWEVNNFNGVTLIHSQRFDRWNTRSSVFYGREDSNSNILAGYSYPGLLVDLSWRNILGADFEISREWFNMRLVYIQSDVDLETNTGDALVGDARQRIYGLAVNMDYNQWLVRSEFSKFDRWDDIGYQSVAGVIGVGYHVGDFTPMISYSRYHDDNSYGIPRWYGSNTTLSLRYDVTPKSAIKIQYDRYQELSDPGSTTGNANILAISYDRIF
jgi:hypothetical protein